LPNTLGWEHNILDGFGKFPLKLRSLIGRATGYAVGNKMLDRKSLKATQSRTNHEATFLRRVAL